MKTTIATRPWHCQHCTAACTKHLLLDYNVFPIQIARIEHTKSGHIFEKHWHEQMQILYFEQGEACIHCNGSTYLLKPKDVLVINSNEIHYGATKHTHLVYYIIKLDLDLLCNTQQDKCQTNYLMPLARGSLCFQNQIAPNPQLLTHITGIIRESAQQNLGWELAIKAHLYQILVHLLRHHQQQTLKPLEQERQQKTLHQFRTVLKYLDEHYPETIRLHELAGIANMSSQHFCRVFKMITGRRPMDYINYLRITKAVSLLSETRLNISEVAMAVGFDDSNYFSRIFKKYKKVSPSALRK